MPTNIQKGNTAQFVIEFISSHGLITVPAGGTIEITYVTGLTTASTAITLTQVSEFFTASWDSSVADYGAAPWFVTAIGSTNIVQASGQLRIIDP